jgi:bacteriorhodopsin
METKQRHGCVTAWLILMIIGNSFSAISYLFMGGAISQNLPEPVPQPMMIALPLIGIANLIFAILLFQWKKWAFWAFTASAFITLTINLSIA